MSGLCFKYLGKKRKAKKVDETSEANLDNNGVCNGHMGIHCTIFYFFIEI